MNPDIAGILLVNKPRGKTAFSLIACLRRILKVQKIGHAGTLDPFATGVMVLLVGKKYTRLSDSFLCNDKAYNARLHLGISTDTFDCEGEVLSRSEIIPTEDAVKAVVAHFQGEMLQVPPMFSAKKIQGKKLYELARQGKTIERQPAKIQLTTTLISYNYPYIDIAVKCSKGTYIRSIADDMGKMLGCGAHLVNLERTQSGNFSLDKCMDGTLLYGNHQDPAVLQTCLQHLQIV